MDNPRSIERSAFRRLNHKQWVCLVAGIITFAGLPFGITQFFEAGELKLYSRTSTKTVLPWFSGILFLSGWFVLSVANLSQQLGESLFLI
jgi:hypothetical protein